MKKLLKVFGFMGLTAVICLSSAGVALAADDPFDCSSNFYQVINGQLKLLNPLTGAYTNIGNAQADFYNAIAYNSLDNYIYGIKTSVTDSIGAVGNLVRIGNDGTLTDLGAVTGLPVSGYVNASMDLAGNMYIRANSTTIYKINVGAKTATPLTITGDPIVNGVDNVFINNKLYFLEADSLSIIDLNTNTASTATVSGPVNWLTSSNNFGAGWADQAGELFFSNNGSGSIYQISNLGSPTPTATFKVVGTVTANNDGANCSVAAQSPFDPPVANDDSYTALYNTPLTITTTPTLSNDLGNGLTVTSHTNPAHGTLSINSDGTFLYTPHAGFTGTDSFDYTVTDSLARTSRATVTITISASSIPKAPNTGYAAPRSPHLVILELDVLALLSLATGSGLLLLQRRNR